MNFLLSLLLLFQFHADCNAPADSNLVPLPTCTSYTATGSSTAYPGGLYAGTNDRPAWLESKRVAALANIVPRDAFGNVDLVNGKIGIVYDGQSYLFAPMNVCAADVAADPNSNPALVFVAAVDGTHAADAISMADPNDPYWDFVETKIAEAGLSDAQVQIAFMLPSIIGNFHPIGPWPDHAIDLAANLAAINDNMATCHGSGCVAWANLAVIYEWPRMTARYGDPTSPLLPVPKDYEEGFGIQWAVLAQTGVCMDWSDYWYDQDVPCSDYGADGVHLSPAGATKYGHRMSRWAKRQEWYR